MATDTNNSRGNLLLDAMPKENYSEFLGHLEHVEVGIREVQQEPQAPVECVYFPINAVFSLVATSEDGGMVEVATMGAEGLVGLSVFLGHPEATLTAFSQVPGSCWKCGVDPFRKALKNGDWLPEALRRYTQCVMVQISQGVICNARHSVAHRCARWLLMTMDRVKRPEFQLTQQFLAQMLAVRRGGVNEAAGALQEKGIIDYSRGIIRVLDREKLEQASCECYRRVAREYEAFGNELHSL